MDLAAAPTGDRSAQRHDRDRAALRSGFLVAGAVAIGAGAIVALDPSDSGVPICWSQVVLGIDCPLCGGLRATNALVRGDWLAAADHNVLVAVGVPLLALGWVVWMVAAWRGRRWPPPSPPTWAVVTVVVVLVAFTVTRNLDAGPVSQWLAATASG